MERKLLSFNCPKDLRTANGSNTETKCQTLSSHPGVGREEPILLGAGGVSNQRYIDSCKQIPCKTCHIRRYMTTVSRFGYVLPLAPRIQSSQRRCWLLRPRVTSCRAKPVVDCIYAKNKISQYYGSSSYVHTTTPVLSIEYKISFVVCASLSVLHSEIGKIPLATAQLEPTTSRTSQKSSDPKGETRNMRFQAISTDQPNWKVYNKRFFHVRLHLEVTTMLFRNPSPTWTEQPQVSHIQGKQT